MFSLLNQLNFFHKGVKSLEVVEPHIKIVAEQQHIDYQLNGLEDNQLEGYEVDHSVENGDDGELSFDYQQHDQHRDVSYFSRNSMEVRKCLVTQSKAFVYLVCKIFSHYVTIFPYANIAQMLLVSAMNHFCLSPFTSANWVLHTGTSM